MILPSALLALSILATSQTGASPLRARQATGKLTSPTWGEIFTAGSTITVTLENYPASSMSEFHVFLYDPVKDNAVLIHQGLGGDSDGSPVTYNIDLPNDPEFNSGSFVLQIDELLCDSTGHVIDTGSGPSVAINIVPPVNVARRTSFGHITQPAANSHFNPGDTFHLTLANYPSTMSEFWVKLAKTDLSQIVTLQEGLGPNGDLSPVTFGITLPNGSPWIDGEFLLIVDEFLRDANGHVSDSGNGPRISIFIS